MYICLDCLKTFDKPSEKIFHDGIITQLHYICPKCGSKRIIENIKRIIKDRKEIYSVFY